MSMVSNFRDPLGPLALVYEAFDVGQVKEGAPTDLNDPDLFALLEAPEPSQANPEQTRRLFCREELDILFSFHVPVCSAWPASSRRP